MPHVQILNHGNRYFAPQLHHPRDQVGFLHAESAIESNRKGDRFVPIGRLYRSEMGVIEGQTGLQSGRIAQHYPEHRQQSAEVHTVNNAQGEKLVNAGYRAFILELGQPGVGDVELFAARLQPHLAAQLFHFARGDPQAIARLL